MPTAGTPQTNVRLTAEDKARIERIRTRYALSAGSDAIRFALAEVCRRLDAEDAAAPTPRRKKS